jgi:hypothetical protein
LSQGPNPELWGPLISISVARYQPAPSTLVPVAPGPTVILRENVTALIDTGSQGTLIDREMAESLGLQPGGGGSGLFLGRELPSPSYLSTLWFPEIPFWYTGDFISGVFSALPFKVLLGWDLLRRFTIDLRRKSNFVRCRRHRGGVRLSGSDCERHHRPSDRPELNGRVRCSAPDS